MKHSDPKEQPGGAQFVTVGVKEAERLIEGIHPYNARHSCVSWHLMVGKNLLWCSTQFGHSVRVMLSNYGRWISDATEEDIRLVREAMATEASNPSASEFPESPVSPSEPQNNATGKGVGTAVLEKGLVFQQLNWRS